jgi:hypothetical protein
LSSFEIMIGLHTQFCESWNNVIFLFWKKKNFHLVVLSLRSHAKQKMLSDKLKLLSLCCRGQKEIRVLHSKYNIYRVKYTIVSTWASLTLILIFLEMLNFSTNKYINKNLQTYFIWKKIKESDGISKNMSFVEMESSKIN